MTWVFGIKCLNIDGKRLESHHCQEWIKSTELNAIAIAIEYITLTCIIVIIIFVNLNMQMISAWMSFKFSNFLPNPNQASKKSARSEHYRLVHITAFSFKETTFIIISKNVQIKFVLISSAAIALMTNDNVSFLGPND